MENIFKFLNVLSIGLESYDAVLKTFLAAKRDLGEILSSCEMIDQDALDCSLDAFNLRYVWIGVLEILTLLGTMKRFDG